jgi:hypothetical protein
MSKFQVNLTADNLKEARAKLRFMGYYVTVRNPVVAGQDYTFTVVV